MRKAEFSTLLLKMIARIVNCINDVLKIQLFFAHLLGILFPKSQALGPQSENWKDKKKASASSSNHTTVKRRKKIPTSIGHRFTFKAARRSEIDSRVDRLHNDNDFAFLKLDKHSVNVEVLVKKKKAKKVFHAWKEG